MKAQKVKFDGTKLKKFITKPVKDQAEEFGITRIYFTLILSGKKTPSTDLALTICKHLSLSIDDISSPV